MNRLRRMGKGLAILMALLGPQLGGATETAEPVELAAGEHVLIRRDHPIGKAAVGDPTVADVEVLSSRELLLEGRAPGATTLILWLGSERETLSIRVRATNAALDAAIREAAGPQLEVDATGALRGQTASLPGLATARKLLERDQAKEVVDASVTDLETQVQIDLRIVELRRQRLRAAGFQFVRSSRGSAQALTPPSGLSGIVGEGAGSRSDGFVFGSPSGFLPVVDGFNLVAANTHSTLVAVLSLLEANGYAHTLAEPTLVTTSGRSASFLAGGEFPVPVAQSGSGSQTSITVEYREFGVRVALLPIVLGPDHIVLEIAPEVSELDFSTGVSAGGVAVPALTTRRADTTVELGDGETLVIGGLIRNDLTSSVEKVPGLGSLPILGPFFRRVRHSREQRELLMIVSPRLVRPLVRGTPLPPLPGAEAKTLDPSNTDLLLRGRGVPTTGFSD